MALAVGSYVWPGHQRLVAVVAVAALTAVNYRGVQKSALATRLIVVAVLGVLTAVVIVCASSGSLDSARLRIGDDVSPRGVLFFAFAGYARIATLGGEVREPRRTIPRAIAISLATTLVVYAVVAVTVLAVLDVNVLARSTAPLVDAVRAAGAPALVPVVRTGAALAALGSLLALILGVSRTTFAMASDRLAGSPWSAWQGAC